MSFIVVISLSVASYKMNSLVFIFNTVPFYKKWQSLTMARASKRVAFFFLTIASTVFQTHSIQNIYIFASLHNKSATSYCELPLELFSVHIKLSLRYIAACVYTYHIGSKHIMKEMQCAVASPLFFSTSSL